MKTFEYFKTEALKYKLNFQAKRISSENFESSCKLCEAVTEKTLFNQNSKSDKIYFLKSGKIKFYKKRKKTNILYMTITETLVPAGVSGLNSPGRYMSSAIISKGSKYYTFDLNDFWNIVDYDPIFGSSFFSFIFVKSISLLWFTRKFNFPFKYDLSSVKISKGFLTKAQGSIPKKVFESAFFIPFSLESIEEISKNSFIKHYTKDDIISYEGRPSDGIYILISGRVQVDFSYFQYEKKFNKKRSIARSGVCLCWHNGCSNIIAPYTIKASRDTSVLWLPTNSIKLFQKLDPIFFSTLMQRQLWQLGRYQQTVSGLSNYGVEHPADILESLLEDNKSRIPVNSVLYATPHALRNKFNVSYGLEQIYFTLFSGNDAEKSVAGLIIDALEDFEKEHRFFNQINDIYNKVTSASPINNSIKLRNRVDADFSELFEYVPYIIKGIKNLPEKPTNIFIYNHLTAIEENKLANGYSFSLDSHFISSKILLHKYGNGGIRIVRSSRKDEFWRSGYYSRLGNIEIHNKESDWIEETSEEKKFRKEKLFIEAQKAFDSNFSLVIAPEGTSEGFNNITENSPGTFKPGAFLLASRLKPEPNIIPIALAYFDKPVSNTTFLAVIKSPFKISNYIKDFNNLKEIETFTTNYQEIFRSYISEARDLANKINDDSTSLDDDILTNKYYVGILEEEFESDIRQLEFNLRKQYVHDPIILYGSSTFTLWENAKLDLNIQNLINLGFGGSTLKACRIYLKRIILPLLPKILIIYAGDNDIANGVSENEIIREFQIFCNDISKALPNTKCFFISIKPSPLREDFLKVIQSVNIKIKNICKLSNQWKYIDIHSNMLDNHGKPDKLLYDNDPLHMNFKGYKILTQSIKKSIKSQRI